jgi:2'-5' RNA ligase
VTRLFAALELPGEVRAALAAWGERAAGREPAIRLVAGDALHVTLVFLGERPAEEVAAIAAVVVGAARQLDPLRVVGAAWLPPRRPGVLVADLEATAGVMALQVALVEALAPWHEPERRGFRPHVTVARVRRSGSIARRDVPAPPALRLAPTALVLYRSHHGAGGSSYEAIASAPLV